MKDRINIIRIKGTDFPLLRKTFCGYVTTGDEDSSEDSDFKGNLDRDMNFYIVKKGHENNQSLNYEARMTGKIYEEDGDTIIEYSVAMSDVFRACFIVVGLLAVSVTGIALYRFFKDLGSGMLLPSSFFVIAFLIMLGVLLVKPDCRAIEKCLEKIAGEYSGCIGRASGR